MYCLNAKKNFPSIGSSGVKRGDCPVVGAIIRNCLSNSNFIYRFIFHAVLSTPNHFKKTDQLEWLPRGCSIDDGFQEVTYYILLISQFSPLFVLWIVYIDYMVDRSFWSSTIRLTTTIGHCHHFPWIFI